MANERLIWTLLMDQIHNPYGVAGLMGNLFAESSLNPLCVTGSWIKASGKTGLNYIMDTTREQFIHDGVAFGLAQWRYWSRKEKLWDYMAELPDGVTLSIVCVEDQIGFLIQEIQTYKTVWNTLLNATNVKAASDIVLERYEKPANVTEKAKEKRARFSHGYFDKFAMEEVPTPLKRYIETTKANVNLRVGNKTKYPLAGKAIAVGSRYEWVATADNNWHAIVAKSGKQVMWISGDFCRVVDE